MKSAEELPPRLSRGLLDVLQLDAAAKGATESFAQCKSHLVAAVDAKENDCKRVNLVLKASGHSSVLL